MDYFGDKIENKQSRDVLFNIIDKVSGYDIYVNGSFVILVT